MTQKLLALLCLFFGSITLASDIYIKLGTTASQTQTRQIQTKLHAMGHNLRIEPKGEKSTLYAGPYDTQTKAYRALQLLKQTFPAAVAVKLHAKPDTPTIQAQSTPTWQTRTREKQSGFFVDVALGMMYAKAKANGNINASLLQTPSSSGISYTLGGGYRFDTQWSGALYYATLSSGDVTFENIYAGAYYDFLEEQSFSLYGGLLVGMSTLSWDTAPLAGATANSGSDSFFVGLEAGADYPLGIEGLSLRASYSLLFADHKTSLAYGTQSGTIEHGMLHNLQLGVRYGF
ncbi:MAG: SPOR domain-containing protein [Methanosarcina mazei]|nr:SPOR domain-containing protein [Methanosarcina mazei]